MSSQLQPVNFETLGNLIPQREFCLHNATDERLTLQYDGESFTLPPFGEVQERNARYPEAPHSLQDEEGKYIPGTLVIRDIVGERSGCDGNRGDFWSAALAIRHCLGIDVVSKQAFGVLAHKGVSFVPLGATKEQIARIAQSGRGRYLDWYERNASDIVAAHEENNASRVKNGGKPVGPSKEVRTALGVLEAARKRDAARADLTVAEFEKTIAAELPPTPDEGDELKKIARRLANQLVEDNELKGDPEKLVEMLESSPEALAIMRTKWKMRKLQERKSDSSGDGVQTDFSQ